MADLNISVLSNILQGTALERSLVYGPMDLEGSPVFYAVPSHGVRKPQGQENMPIRTCNHIFRNFILKHSWVNLMQTMAHQEA